MPADDHDVSRDGPLPADDHPTDQQLRDELAGATSPADSQRLVAHLDGCTVCRHRLDRVGEAPVSVGGSDDPMHLDGRSLRRAVRRTLFGIAARTVALLVLVAVGAQLVGALVIHPLLVDRGDRLERHVVASIDLAVLQRPGAEIRGYLSNSGVLRRTTEVQVLRHVGGTPRDLGSYETRLSPLRTTFVDGAAPVSGLGPRLSGDPVDRSTLPFDAERFGDGVAATVELAWHDGLDPDAAADLVAGREEVALTWVGFTVSDLPPENPGSRLGYGACAAPPEFIGGRGAGFGSSGGFRTFGQRTGDGVEQALTQVRRAVDNLAAEGTVGDRVQGTDGALSDLPATARWLDENDPEVTSVVLTGSVPVLAAIVEEHDPDTAGLLEVDLDRASPEPCG